MGVKRADKRKWMKREWIWSERKLYKETGQEHTSKKKAAAQKVEGMEARKTEIATGNCIETDLERVG